VTKILFRKRPSRKSAQQAISPQDGLSGRIHSVQMSRAERRLSDVPMTSFLRKSQEHEGLSLFVGGERRDTQGLSTANGPGLPGARARRRASSPIGATLHGLDGCVRTIGACHQAQEVSPELVRNDQATQMMHPLQIPDAITKSRIAGRDIVSTGNGSQSSSASG